MKRLLTLTLLIIIAGTANSQQSTANSIYVRQSDFSQIELSFTAPAISVQETPLLGNLFCTIAMDGFSAHGKNGMPALPTMVKTIEVPLGNGLRYEIRSMVCDTIDGTALGISHPIAPAQPSRRKSDRSTPTLVIDSAAYSTNAFCGAPIIVVEEIGVARNRNLASVTFNPISWNPTTNQIIIVRSVDVVIRQKNADIDATMRMKSLHASADFGFGIDVINKLGNGPKDSHTSVPIRYTIVAHSMFRGALDEFANWKRRKGFMVDLVYTDDQNVGSTTTSIKQYLTSLYENATESEPAPTYVLLVGDREQIPAFQLTSYSSTHYSDLRYTCWTSGDNIPDCYIGRFSAQELDQLTPQISKTLMYEQYTFPDDSYLNKAALIAGVDGGRTGDHGYTHADPTMDYAAYNYVNSANGFTSVTYYKNNPNSHPDGVTVTGSSGTSTTAQALRNLYNSGCGFVNYSAHGDNTYWGNPEFSVSHVNQMTNQNKPMVVIGNCCLTNSFQVATCLGEAFLRKGDNAGGVSYIGASDYTYWDEDVYWSMGVRSQISATMSKEYDPNKLGMYDKLFHTHGESYDKWHITLGAMIYAGNMAVQNSSSDASMKTYYWEVYHLMGDPSLMPYIHGVPQNMTLSFSDTIPMGVSSFDVHCAPYAYVAMTDEEYNIISAAYADANGYATLILDEQKEIPSGTYEIAASAQGYKQQFKSLHIAPPDVYVKALELVPVNAVKAGEHVAFNVSLKNIGILPAENIYMEFRSADGKMLIDTVGAIALNRGLNPDEELTLSNACSAHVWDDVADQETATINVIVSWGDSSEHHTVTKYRFSVDAADIHTRDQYLSRPMDSTSTAQLTIISINAGHAELENATATLLPLDPTLSVDNSDTTFSLAEGETMTKDFTITANGTIPTDRVIPMLYTIANNSVRFTDSLLVTFGEPSTIINFNDQTWGEVSWTSNEHPWEITSYNPYEGSYCARSKTWSNNSGNRKTSETSLSVTTSVDDSLTFYYRVSSEENYDNFNFYIDNERVMQASGETGWSRAAFFIPAGTHVFKFAYAKDYYLDEGEDAAFIDNLKLPYTGSGYYYLNDTACLGSDYTFVDTVLSGDNLTEGTYQFTRTAGDNVHFLTLTVVPVPQTSIEGGDVTIHYGETVRLTADAGTPTSPWAFRYLWDNGDHHPIIDVYPTKTTTYTVTAFNGRCSSSASTTITVDGTPVSINSQQPTANSQISVYPNPANDKLTVWGEGITGIIITDIMGRIERRMDCTPIHQYSNTPITIDIRNLSNGIHLIQVSTDNGTKQVEKLIKR